MVVQSSRSAAGSGTSATLPNLNLCSAPRFSSSGSSMPLCARLAIAPINRLRRNGSARDSCRQSSSQLASNALRIAASVCASNGEHCLARAHKHSLLIGGAPRAARRFLVPQLLAAIPLSKVVTAAQMARQPHQQAVNLALP